MDEIIVKIDMLNIESLGKERSMVEVEGIVKKVWII